MNTIGIILSILIIFAVGYLIMKKYNPQAVLLGAGIILLVSSQLFGIGSIVAEESSSGVLFFDIFEYLKAVFSNRAGGLGLIIMTVGGFAKYMEYIGAGKAMVNVSLVPLKKIPSPYMIVAFTYVIGQMMNIFIPSATGLAVLLMAVAYPLLKALGISNLSAAAVIATTAALDLGPASGMSNVAAETAEMGVMTYFLNYQMVVAVPTIIVIAILHYIVNKRGDEKMNHKAEMQDVDKDGKFKNIPGIYSILPVIPLVLLLIFNEIVYKVITLHVIVAMLIGLFIGIIAEMLYKRNMSDVFSGLQTFFDGMGVAFAKVVSLIIAATVFAQGIKTIGLMNAIIDGAQTLGFGPIPMTIVMTLIIIATSIVTGSGVASFTSFAILAPAVATAFSINPVVLILAMQLSAGIGRSMSPVAACVLVPAGEAGVTSIDIVKRTIVPMLGGLFTVLIIDFVFFL